MGDLLNKREADSDDEEDHEEEEEEEFFTESESEDDEAERETEHPAEALEALALEDGVPEASQGVGENQLEEGEFVNDEEEEEEDDDFEHPPADDFPAIEEEAPAVRAPKREPQPYDVPTSGHFWLHDDRLADDTSAPPRKPPKKVWDPVTDEMWVHDKFHMLEAGEDDGYRGSFQQRKGNRGGGGRGRRGGGDREEGDFQGDADYFVPARREGNRNDGPSGRGRNDRREGGGRRARGPRGGRISTGDPLLDYPPLAESRSAQNGSADPAPSGDWPDVGLEDNSSRGNRKDSAAGRGRQRRGRGRDGIERSAPPASYEQQAENAVVAGWLDPGASADPAYYGDVSDIQAVPENFMELAPPPSGLEGAIPKPIRRPITIQAPPEMGAPSGAVGGGGGGRRYSSKAAPRVA